MITFKLYGADGYTCQIPRIADGLRGIGHKVVYGDEKHDVIYNNNFRFDDIEEKHGDSSMFDKNGEPQKAFKIFNVLDIPPHVPDFPIETLKEQLSHADIVTCISEPVQQQLKDIGVDSHVIWNPIKDLCFDPTYKRDIKCLYVGRAADRNKRAWFLRKFVNQVVQVGSESLMDIFNGELGSNVYDGNGNIIGTQTDIDPNKGKYLGLVSDISLINLLNRSLVVALPTKFEGLGLPALEAMVCGALPLVCRDNPNSKLCPDFCIAEPNEDSVFEKWLDLINNFNKYQKIILEDYAQQSAFKFSKFSVAKNIADLYIKYKK